MAHYITLLYASNGTAPMEVSHFQAICDVRDDLVLGASGWLNRERDVTTILIAPDHDSVMLVSPQALATQASGTK